MAICCVVSSCALTDRPRPDGVPPVQTRRFIPCWQRWLFHGLPESIGLLLALAPSHSLLQAGLAPTLLRLAWVAAELIHGAGHTLVRALVDGDPSTLRICNVLEHRAPRRIVQSLLPLAVIGLAGVGPLPAAWLHTGDPDPWKVRLKASGGILLHGAVILIAGMALNLLPGSGTAMRPEGPFSDLLVFLILSNIAMVMVSRSDLRTMVTGVGRHLHCGNFGFIAAPETPGRGDLLSTGAIERFDRMGWETELRGAQAGGGLLMTRDLQGQNRFVGHKIVNAKRGDLTTALESGFRRQRRRAWRSGIRSHPSALLATWHYRFGTSGPPGVDETHWLEWSPLKQRHLWHLDRGQWRCLTRTVNHRITHNGDFEAFHIDGADVDMSSLGQWLGRVLQRPAAAVVDSARIAGMMDLLICQGEWFAAVRLGFLMTLAPYPHIGLPAALEHWAQRFETSFRHHIQEASGPQASPDRLWIQSLMERILSSLKPDPLLRRHRVEDLRRWILTAIEAFLYNDPSRAVQEFMDRARGSFGLAVVSTTWPDRLVLCSLGQPITIGMDPETGLALYASESTAVDSVLAPADRAWRIDLDQNAGEIAVLSSDDLQITSLSLERMLEPEELQLRRHPYGGRPGQGAGATCAIRLAPMPSDPVAADIASIPALLCGIRNGWIDPGSPNRQSADVLAQLLIAKAANVAEKENLLRQAGLDPNLAKSRHVDLLITGVENSLWCGEQFGRDLSALMPLLSVKALSANAVLKALQNDIESLALARQSIVLVISHSGRTFPSLQVMEACDLLVRRGLIREVFILIGEPDSLHGSPLLASQSPGEPCSRRLFTTGAGRRRAEPATATVAALHLTLTELLFCLSRQLLQAFSDEQRPPLGMRLSRDDLTCLVDLEDHYFLDEISEILGVDALGQKRPTAISRRLEHGGRVWGQHVLEAPMAWAIHAVYILISVGFGLPLFQTLTRTGTQAIALSGGGIAELLLGVALAADIGLYVFGPWCWTLALRWWQGRPLLARTGRRCVVVGDAPWVHVLLTNYISKLFSLSFGIASVDVQGADPADHLLHTHAHRVVRGTLLFLGIPDGRCSSLQRMEANGVLLAARQSDGIRNCRTGPEIVAVGSDPAITAGPFRKALVLPSHIHDGCADERTTRRSNLIEALRESRFGSFRRLLASYLFFWAMACHVARLPLLRFKWWRSQSRTRVMTTAAPISAARLDLAEPREVAELALDRFSPPEQS